MGSYYLFFMSVPLLQNLSKAISTNIRPYTFVVGAAAAQTAGSRPPLMIELQC